MLESAAWRGIISPRRLCAVHNLEHLPNRLLYLRALSKPPVVVLENPVPCFRFFSLLFLPFSCHYREAHLGRLVGTPEPAAANDWSTLLKGRLWQRFTFTSVPGEFSCLFPGTAPENQSVPSAVITSHSCGCRSQMVKCPIASLPITYPSVYAPIDTIR